MSGRDRVHPHAEVAELAREDPGHAPDGRLAGHVVHEAWGANEDRAGRDVDDDTAALLAEQWSNRRAAAPDTANVDRHDPIPLVDWNRIERLGRSPKLTVERGVVDQDVDPTVLVHGGIDHVVHAGIVGDIDSYGQAADLIGNVPRTVLCDVGDDDARTFSRERPAIPCSESTAAAGYDRDLAVECHQRAPLVSHGPIPIAEPARGATQGRDVWSPRST